MSLCQQDCDMLDTFDDVPVMDGLKSLAWIRTRDFYPDACRLLARRTAS